MKLVWGTGMSFPITARGQLEVEENSIKCNQSPKKNIVSWSCNICWNDSKEPIRMNFTERLPKFSSKTNKVIWIEQNVLYSCWQCTYLIKPMPRETSHSFQLSLTVEVNFPRNSTIKIYNNRTIRMGYNWWFRHLNCLNIL